MLAILTALVILSLASPAMAWGTSVNVASVDDTNSWNTGDYYPSDYPNQHFTNVAGSSISASTLVSYDTIIFWGFNPSTLSSSQKTDIVNWISNGGKLIIWDSEDSAPNGWDYTWLPYPFVSVGPGAMGASGYPLTIVEENTLSSNDPTSPYYINTNEIGQSTDAVGDANLFTSFTSDWTVDMEAKNYLGTEGPVHVYSQPGNGLIIYNGLDFDYAGYGYSGAGASNLKKILRQELESSYLPSGSHWTGNLNVVKVSDKTQYQIGDTITFTVTVENPTTNQFTAENVVLTDMPPAEISVPTTTYSLGDIAPGQSVTQTITTTAIASGTGIKNEASALGSYNGKPVFSGSGVVTFDVLSQPVDTAPPTLTCPADVTVEQETAAGTVVPLTATATDDLDTNVDITSNAPAIFPLGDTTVTFTATDDAGNIATGTTRVTVIDTTAPTLTCPADIKDVEQTNLDGTPVTLPEATATDICDAKVTITNDAPAVFPLGTTTVTFTAKDASGNIATGTTRVTVQDTTKPTIKQLGETKVLWPANHKYQTVSISDLVSITDICDAGVAQRAKILSVSSDEPEDANGNGDGNTLADIVIKDDKTVDLRAEREGTGNGRVYTISFEVTDASGNTQPGSSQVWIPHDMANPKADDNGPVYIVNFP